MTLGMLHAYHVGWPLPGLEWSNIPSAVCVAHPEDEQVKLETRRGP
jgi:hypothetical protein